MLYAHAMEPSPPTADISPPAPPSHRDYLLCIEGERSWTFPLPPAGEVIIGRANEAGLRLGDDLVSRAHAQILVVADGIRIQDLGSRHGTLLNGQPLSGARMLASGDVITVGGAMLIVHRPVRNAGGRGMLEGPALLRRLEEELERSLRYRREVALIVLRSKTAFDRARVASVLQSPLRLIDAAAFLTDRELAILLPEIDLDEATAVATTLATTLSGVSCGIAVSPADGLDVDTLMSSARAAASGTESVGYARDVVQHLKLGEHDVVLAEPAMIRIYDLIRRLARSRLPILIQGETGAGKELAAAAVHAFSPRAAGPFVSINCAAIPEHLAETELFGHERGAFTGAIAAKQGSLELASGGTVFLDEIGEMPLAIQAKFLRVLETQEVTRVGDVRPRTTDIRVVAATNRDLEAEVEAGRFRADLFFRLGAAQVVVPPLRDRPRDLAFLIQRMFAAACARLERRPLTLTVAATQALLLHPWPGNVRELKNAMDYTAAATPDSTIEVDTYHLPATVTAASRIAQTAAAEPSASKPVERALVTGRRVAFRPIDDEVRELERQRMIEALAASDGIQNKAAELIEMPLRTFVTKLKRYGITPADWSG
ncbi:MAG: sigma 54-interacting transcriptional regulator [Kofleriaceae bacterium]